MESNNPAGILRPSLAPMCRLYFDPVHKRWVIRAPNQVIFPDSESLEVLLLCDGKQSVDQISDKLEENRQQNINARGDTAKEIVMRFVRRGVLETTTL